MKTKLPQPGENEKGQRPNALPIDYERASTRDPITSGNRGRTPELAAQASEGKGVIGQVHKKVPSPANSAAQAGAQSSGGTGMQDQEELLEGIGSVVGNLVQAAEKVVGSVAEASKGPSAETEDQGEELSVVQALLGAAEMPGVLEKATQLVTTPMGKEMEDNKDPFASSVPRSVEEQYGFSARPMAESAADCYARKFGERK